MISTAELVGRWEPARPQPRLHRLLLGLTALRGWVGKEVLDAGQAYNLALRHGREQRVLPMRLSVEASLADGEQVAVLSYPDGTPVPFRWMRDELRWRDDAGDELAGQTFLLVGGRRLGPTPFRLRRA